MWITTYGLLVSSFCAANDSQSFPPMRSPIAVHSLIANWSRGLRLVEVGTRQGDSIACYKRYASYLMAIEISPAYCRSLRLHASATVDVLCPTNAFASSQWVRQARADAITFWLDEHTDPMMVEYLFSLKQQRVLDRATRIWVLSDHQLWEDLQKMSTIISRWRLHVARVENVSFDERSRCNAGMRLSRKRPSRYVNCRRAVGTFSVIELM